MMPFYLDNFYGGFKSEAALTQQKPAQVLTLKETTMSTLMEEDINRWTAKRKTALVLDIIQGKTRVS